MTLNTSARPTTGPPPPSAWRAACQHPPMPHNCALSSGDMRDEEVFVAEALVEHLGGPSRASYDEGDDPPDVALKWDGRDIGVEVTRLIQKTFQGDGSLGNRASDDAFGLRLVDDLNSTLGGQLPSDLDIIIHLEMPVEPYQGGLFLRSYHCGE